MITQNTTLYLCELFISFIIIVIVILFIYSIPYGSCDELKIKKIVKTLRKHQFKNKNTLLYKLLCKIIETSEYMI